MALKRANIERMTRTRLRAWRLAQGLTMAEVADLTGFSPSMLSRLERGERVPIPRTKVLIARALGVSIRDLFDVDLVDEHAA